MANPDPVDDMVPWGLTDFFSEVGRFLLSLERQYGIANKAFTEYAVNRLAVCLRSVTHLSLIVTEAGEEASDLSDYLSNLQLLSNVLSSLINLWEEYEETLDSVENGVSVGYTALPERTGRRGRPRFDISADQLEYLRSLSFSWNDIASLLGVSRMTIYRKRVEYGMLVDQRDQLSDSELDALITDLRQDLPYSGQTVILGHLRSTGCYTTRSRVRASIRRTDPINTPQRWGGGTHQRRPYSVPGPNSLWHLDGHHKLIRWRFVTHGGVDGFSRLLVYLKCSTNNRASTVYSQFMSAIQRYGLPSRIRTDCGTENLQVARHMLRNRGFDRNSVITGSSTHNQRIERLWRDLHQSVTKLYYRLFYHLENLQLLDPLNELHLFALHYVFLPRINRSIELFRNAWNHHSLRTMQNSSPYQLYTEGALRLQRTNLPALDFFNNVDMNYGVDENEVVVQDTESESVTVPENRLNLTEENLAVLRLHVDPLGESDNFGIDMYESTVTFLETSVQS